MVALFRRRTISRQGRKVVRVGREEDVKLFERVAWLCLIFVDGLSEAVCKGVRRPMKGPDEGIGKEACRVVK